MGITKKRFATCRGNWPALPQSGVCAGPLLELHPLHAKFTISPLNLGGNYACQLVLSILSEGATFWGGSTAASSGFSGKRDDVDLFAQQEWSNVQLLADRGLVV